jgi:D-glycero-alpha-D-manno-heptose-7-phosphate kinase
MIITRTPLRISLAGGGTDLPAFYTQSFGAVVSFAINKYVTVAVSEKFDGRVRASYSITENVDRSEQLRHDILRESLGNFGVKGVEVVTISDIPGEGTGLGSSSALAVGLVHALRKWTGRRVNVHPSLIAEEAYTIERLMCGHPCGKQDHFAAAYGGLHAYRFEPNEDVTVRLVEMSDEQRQFLENDMLLFYTGRARRANELLKDLEGRLRSDEVTQNLGLQLRDIAVDLGIDLLNGNFTNIAKHLHEGWMLKRRMAKGISDPALDEMYQAALRAGAGGGKLLGAGGGGFFLFAGCWNHQHEIERTLGLRRVWFKIDPQGSRIVYNG